MTTTIDRFWAKVNKDGPVPSHCPDLLRLRADGLGLTEIGRRLRVCRKTVRTQLINAGALSPVHARLGLAAYWSADHGVERGEHQPAEDEEGSSEE